MVLRNKNKSFGGIKMYNLEKTKKALLDRLGYGKSTELKLKNGKEILVGRDLVEGYSLYEGCELIVGDVSLDYAARVIIDIANL